MRRAGVAARACAANGFIARPFQIDTILDAVDYHPRAP